jgi:flagellar P-ring protein precursor FlgI
MKKIFTVLLILSLSFLVFCSAFGVSPPVRVKDIAHVLEARENQLMGFGLVIGLKHTGDSAQTGFTKQALTNVLSRMGMAPQDQDFRSKNVAAVIVTTNIPAFVKPGQKLDVTVSSVGDASSLKGGVLLQTPLMGADNLVYAVAQGGLSIGEGSGGDMFPTVKTSHVSGSIPSGAIVEKEIPTAFDQKNITVVLDMPDFTTASRVAESIKKLDMDAKAVDAATVIVPVFKGEDPVALIARLEVAPVVPDVVARVVINDKTGIVVIGENVRMAPVAVAYKGFSVSVGNINVATKVSDDMDETSSSAGLKVSGPERSVYEIPYSASISDLVKALNALGATPKDLIMILQSIKAAGALPAEIEIIS